MSDNPKLRPEDLTAEERALWDALAVERVTRNSCCPEQAYEFTDDWASRLILARRALFAPATEKVVCPNCKRDDTGHSWKVNGELRYSCNGWNKPAQPEPAAQVESRGVWRCECCAEIADPLDSAFRWNGECWQHHHAEGQTHFDCQLFGPKPEPAAPVSGHTPIGEYDPDMKPAATEMPEAVRKVCHRLRHLAMTSAIACRIGDRDEFDEYADALESWWRTHSQPVAHPFKAGFKPDSMRHFAEYVRDNWHYFGTDTAGLAHQFVQEMDSQPVAVGMTEDRKTYTKVESLLAALRWDLDRFPGQAILHFADQIDAAEREVRQQAAQVAK